VSILSGSWIDACPSSLAMSHAARPTAAHCPAGASRFPWSQRFDHIFRNEGVTGSNPVSSTKSPGQGASWPRRLLAGSTILRSHAPQAAHKTPARSTSFLARCFLTPPHTRSHGEIRSSEPRTLVVDRSETLGDGGSRATSLAHIAEYARAHRPISRFGMRDAAARS